MLEALPENFFLLRSDKTHFHLCGTVNKQNIRWAPENPHEVCQTPFNSEKITVWWEVFSFGIVKPYFVEDSGQTVTVNSDQNVRMLRDIFSTQTYRIHTKNWQGRFWWSAFGDFGGVVPIRRRYSSYSQTMNEIGTWALSWLRDIPHRKHKAAYGLTSIYPPHLLPVFVFERILKGRGV